MRPSTPLSPSQATSTTDTASIAISTALRYTPLTKPKTSIRIATLHPGERKSSLEVTIRQVSFASRPIYHALSYAWGTPQQTKTVNIDGRLVEVRSNLHAALLHLRDQKKEIILWIDAICIDQSNIEERNQQVALMAYIYTRAQQVIVWLGVVDAQNQTGNSPLWHLTCAQSYWQRLWIVQEIGAAVEIEVHWDERRIRKGSRAHMLPTPRSYPWDVFFSSLEQHGLELELPSLLFKQRKQRYGDGFLLANLMRVCQHLLCEDPRDKIYGLVGIAHDCQDGSFPLDYSKSYFDVYRDAIEFHHKSAARRGYIDVVSFSQLVHKVFGGVEVLERDLAEREVSAIPLRQLAPSTNVGNSETITISGLFARPISYIGPSYNSILGDPDAWKSWKALLHNCSTDQEKLRRKNEAFLGTLICLSDADLRKVAAINATFTSELTDKLRSKLAIKKKRSSRKTHPILPSFANRRPLEDENHRLVATHCGVIGLAPGDTEEGDYLVDFLGSDVVAVLRIEPRFKSSYQIMGRAVIAKETNEGIEKFHVPLDSERSLAKNFVSWQEDMVSLQVDMMTLHLLTCR